jgi:hypothetical protein
MFGDLQEIAKGETILSKSEKIHIPLVEVAKTIKQRLKKLYPYCKFSIQTQFYSMGSSLHISVMETNFKIVIDSEEISEVAFLRYAREGYRTREELKEIQKSKHYQLAGIGQNEIYDSNVWNNGVFLTEKGFNLIKEITKLSNNFNYDDSDSQTDYFDVNFYLHLNIGKWDKPFIENI